LNRKHLKKTMASSTKDSSTVVEASSLGDGAPVKLDDPHKVLSDLSASLLALSSPDVDWKEIDKSIWWIRCLACFDSVLLSQRPPPGIFGFLRCHANSLRSAIAKGALSAFEELFSHCSGMLRETVDLEDLDLVNLLSLLVLKSVSEKKFIADGAKKALDALSRVSKSGDLSNTIILALVDIARATKNPRMTAVACGAALLCMESMNEGDRRAFLKTEEIVAGTLEIESGKSTEARPFAQKILRSLNISQGADRLNQAFDALRLGEAQRKRAEDVLRIEGKGEKKASGGVEKPWLAAKANRLGTAGSNPSS
jgi:hypothetical protein